MLNYANLNDVEFEYLCQDIMSKKLKVKLRRFAAGRDGGIDLKNDNFLNKSIVVQVKHYPKTDVSGLVSSLKKEIPKVKEINPDEYYICCSKELSAAKIKEIYEMFTDYMESEANIITINEIDDFLTSSYNIEILRNHYKLWISSTSILQDIYTNDLFIDCEVLLSNIHSEEKLFVQTEAYNRALEYLSKNKTLFIIGNPGVGKTVTSKMLLLYYAANGYRIRYTTDGTDIAALKRGLSQDQDTKEIVLLDDCFGQAYFNMKETQGNELLSLIKYVNMSEKKRLILNSRITIYQEAQIRTLDLVRSFECKEFKVYIIDMSNISKIEKAKIFYNHLYFNNIDTEYFSSIKKDKNYRKIVDHVNYNPRIIEFVSNKHRYSEVPPCDYFNFIYKHLNNPEKIWEDEYERKLSKTDRILLTTIYSLTDTVVSLELVKQCFNVRIQYETGIDLTINQFQNSLARLQVAFIKIVDEKGKRMLSMVNPSVNDYLDARIKSNIVEKNNLINSAVSVIQLERLLPSDQYQSKIMSAFKERSILDYVFENETAKSNFITYFIALNKILDSNYQKYVISYLNQSDVNLYSKEKSKTIMIFTGLFNKNIRGFYEIDKYLSDFYLLRRILSAFDLPDLVTAFDFCFEVYCNNADFITMFEKLFMESVELYCDNIDADQYDIDIREILENAYVYGDDWDDGYQKKLDINEAAEGIKAAVQELVRDEILEYRNGLPEKMHISDSFINEVYIGVTGAEELVKAYYETYIDDKPIERMLESSNTEIDLLFNR